MNRIYSFVKKHIDIVSYLFFGGLTTVVSFVIYFSLCRYVRFSAAWSNAIAWVAAVLFAFLTNKPFVFRSNNWSLSVVIPELGKFAGSRLVSGLLETVFLALTVDILDFQNLAMKIIASVIVVILNYVSSKLIVFRKRK